MVFSSPLPPTYPASSSYGCLPNCANYVCGREGGGRERPLAAPNGRTDKHKGGGERDERWRGRGGDERREEVSLLRQGRTKPGRRRRLESLPGLRIRARRSLFLSGEKGRTGNCPLFTAAARRRVSSSPLLKLSGPFFWPARPLLRRNDTERGMTFSVGRHR